MKASHEIELRPGYKISFIDYYENKYNLTIHDADQPILLSRKVIVLLNNYYQNDQMITIIRVNCYVRIYHLFPDARASNDIHVVTMFSQL